MPINIQTYDNIFSISNILPAIFVIFFAFWLVVFAFTFLKSAKKDNYKVINPDDESPDNSSNGMAEDNISINNPSTVSNSHEMKTQWDVKDFLSKNITNVSVTLIEILKKLNKQEVFLLVLILVNIVFNIVNYNMIKEVSNTSNSAYYDGQDHESKIENLESKLESLERKLKSMENLENELESIKWQNLFQRRSPF
jgi:hypothetical protein